jgi:hypothetical protein
MGALWNNYSRKKNNVNWPTTEIFGKPVMHYQEIPIRLMDNLILTNTMATVS